MKLRKLFAGVAAAVCRDTPQDLILHNEQVVRSNRISSSKVKSPKSGFAPSFSGIFVYLRKCLSRGMWALITPIS